MDVDAGVAVVVAVDVTGWRALAHARAGSGCYDDVLNLLSVLPAVFLCPACKNQYR